MQAQTTGLIIKPAGTGVNPLDPNGDGYASVNPTGYAYNDYDHAETEIPFVAIVRPDPPGDPVKGPSGMFNDIVGTDNTGENAIFTYTDGTNLFFRFRLDGFAPNSKTYSVLIDTDQKFGFTGSDADPNAKPGNPGFEIEVALQTNFGVYVYDIDNENTLPSAYSSFSGETNYQKSIAYTSNSSNPDYFYDYYVPLSSLPGVTAETKMRYVALTTMNPNGAMGSNAQSDVGGTSEGDNLDNIFTDLIGEQTPTAPGQEVLVRSLCPSINTPILENTSTITGTSSEANGTVIKIYLNGSSTSSGQGTVSSGIWSVSVSPSLTGSGTLVSATATAPGKGESASSCNNETIGAVCLDPPYTLSLLQANKGVSFSITTSIPNVTVTLYDQAGNLALGSSSSITFATPGTYADQQIAGGTGQSLAGDKYYLLASASGACPSTKMWICGGKTGTFTPSSTPVINSPITTSSGTVTGTGVTGATVYLYITDDVQIGTTVVSSGTWSITPSTPLENCSYVYARQIETATDRCISNNSAQVRVDNNIKSQPPVVFSTGCISTATLTSVTGFSTEAAGTIIRVYNASTNAQIGGTATVSSSGSWTLTGVSISPGTSIYAKAFDSGNCRYESDPSNTVTVNTQTALGSLSITTTPITENVTSTITGNGTSGATVNLYIDETELIGTGTVTGGIWSITIDASKLYAGGYVTATQTTGANCESEHSSAVQVQCQAPDTYFTLSAVEPGYCEQEFGEIYISSSEIGVIYTPVLASNNSTFGYSAIGTGAGLTLTTFGLVTNPTVFKVRATKISGLVCQSIGSSNVSVVMYPNPLKSLTVSPSNTSVCASGSVNVTIAGSESNVLYQLRNSATNAAIGLPLQGNGGNLILNSGALYSSLTIKVTATKIYGSTSCEVELNNTVSVSVTGPATNQTVSATSTFLCSPQTVSIYVVTANDGLTYRVFGTISGLVGSFVGDGTNKTVTTPTINQTETFYVLITGSGCTDVRLQNEVTVYLSTLTVSNATITPVNCFGGNNGAISISTTGGVNTPSYQWSNNATTASIGGLVSGSYTLTLKDGADCQYVFNYSVPQPEELVLTPTIVQNEVNGNDGQVLFYYSKGTPNYNLEWVGAPPNPGSDYGSVSNLPANSSPYLANNFSNGNYKATLIDSKGCTKTTDFIILESSCVLVNGIITNVSCHGLSDGSIELLTDHENLTYAWNTGATTKNITGLSAGSYSVTVTCTTNNEQHTFSYTVIQPSAPPSVSDYSITKVRCYGEANGVITINTVSGGTPGYNYTWTGPLGWPGSNSQSITNLEPGSYTLIVTDSRDCFFQETYNVSHLQPEPLGLTLKPYHVDPYGESNGAIKATVTGGVTPYSYVWSHNTTLYTDSVSQLTAGSYQLTVTDANGCTILQSINLTQPIDASSNCSYTIGDNFNGGGTGGNNLSTGQLGWINDWAYSGTTGRGQIASVNCPNSSNALRLGGLGSNTSFNASYSRQVDLSVFSLASLIFDYCVTAVGNNETHTFTILFNNVVVKTLTINPSLNNVVRSDTTTITSAYLINPSTITFRLESNGNTTTTINIDNVRISSTKNFKVTANPTNLSCFGVATGSISTTVNTSEPGISDYSYLWSNSTTSSSISGLSAGKYTLRVTDRGGCILNVDTITVTQPGQLSATINATNPSCPGTSSGSINILSPINGNGTGYQFKVTRGSTVISNPEWTSSTSFTGLIAGTYQVYMRNATAPQCETTVNLNVVLNDADVTNPVIVCPANMVRTTNTTSCQANVNVPGPVTMTDNCGTPTLTWTATGAKTGSGSGNVGNNLSPYPVGVTTITYRATDASGNWSECSFTVTVNTNLDPSGLGVSVLSVCQGISTTAYVTGRLTDGSYNINYSLSEANTGNHTATINVQLGAGGGNFAISNDKIANHGNTKITLTSITSASTTCQTPLNVQNTFNISLTPDAPTGNATQSFCASEGRSLNNLAITGTQIKYYNQASDGTQLLGSTLLAHNTTYYVSQTLDGCESVNRLAVTAIVNAEPTINSTTPGSRCGTGTVGLTATASSGTIRWYDAAIGGTLLGIGGTFNTPSLVTTTSYWVTATDNGCENPTRTEVVATINSIPTITSVSDGEKCGTGSVSLSASASEGSINWYSVSSGGISLGTGGSFNTPSIASTTTYYVDATINGCTTPTRNGVTATIKPIPTITSSNGGSRCGPGTVTLSATPSSGTVNWYDSPIGVNLVHSSSSTYEPNLSASATFYAEAFNNGCSSESRTAVSGTIIAYPTGTLSNNDGDNTICSGQSVTFSATGGTSYEFFVNSGSQQTGVGSTYTTSNLANNDVVSVHVTNSGCTSTNYNTISMAVNPIPTISLGSVSPVCMGAESIALTYTSVSESPNLYSIEWDLDALDEDFTELANGTLGVSTINISIPNDAPNGTYNGSIYVTNSTTGCSSIQETFSVIIDMCINITAQPVNNQVCAGDNVQFSITATAPSPTYQWQVNSGSGWGNLTGQTATTLNLTAVNLSMKGYQYRCVVSNGPASVPSDPATLIVDNCIGCINSSACTDFATTMIDANNGTLITSNGNETYLNLTNGQYFYIPNGINFTGSISSASSGSFIIIAETGQFNPSSFNNFAGTIRNYSTLAPVNINNPFSGGMENYGGVVNFTDNNFNGTCLFLNCSGEMNWTNSGNFNLNSASTIYNSGIITMASSQLQGNGCIVNDGWMTIQSYVGSNNFYNNGKVELLGPSLYFNGGEVVNNCAFFSAVDGASFQNNTNIENNGLIYLPEGTWETKGGKTFVNNTTGVVRTKNLVNEGIVTGTGGRFYVTGNSHNKNNGVFGQAGDPINFYDSSPGGATGNFDQKDGGSSIGNAVFFTSFPQPTYSPDLAAYQCGDVVNAVTVNPGSIGNNQTICVATDVQTLINIEAASCSDADATITYQWESCTDNVNFANITGATSATYNPVSVSVTTYYKRKALATFSGDKAILNTSGFSNTVTVTKNTGTPSSITAQPSNQSICNDGNATFSVTAIGADSYQWQVSTDNGIIWADISNNTIYTGVSTNTLQVSAPGSGFNNYLYSVHILNASCGNLTSASASLTITGPCIEITAQPSPRIACATANATFTIETDDDLNYTFQWQVNTGSGWGNLAGQTGTTLSLNAVTLSMNGYQYQCIVGDGSATVTSSSATLTVNQLPVNSYTVSDPTICFGAEASIDVSGSESGVNYQLRLNSDDTNVGSPVSGTGSGFIFTVSPASTTSYNVLAIYTSTGCSVKLDDLANITVNNPSVSITTSYIENCPDLIGDQGFEPNNTGYDAGATKVTFTVTLNGSTTTNWEFDYVVEDATVRLGSEPGEHASPNPQIGTDVEVTGASKSLEFYINNTPGSQQVPVFKVTSVKAGGCTDNTERTLPVTIKAMPVVGSFN